LWENFRKKADPAADDKILITAEVLGEALWKQRDDPELKRCLVDLNIALFNLMDTNNDGYLDIEEHRRMFHQVGIPDTWNSRQAFNAIDVNHDGKLSVQEFGEADYEFFFSDDENSPYSLFFGPLVD